MRPYSTPDPVLRRSYILNLILSGAVNVNAAGARADLARLLGVSPATITRDLAALRRAQGPATSIGVRRGRPALRRR